MRMSQSFLTPIVRELLPTLVSLPLAYLWIRVVVPLLVRPFGIELSVGLVGWREWRAELAQLNRGAYVVVVGVLMWGCWMAVAPLIMGYVRWKYLGGGWLIPVRDLAYGMMFWSIAGVFLGWSTWPAKHLA